MFCIDVNITASRSFSAIIFYRLDNKSRCTECNKFCQRRRGANTYCDEPCETWKGGIRFTQSLINLNGKNIDTLKARKEIISSQEGIKNAEVFKSKSTFEGEFEEKLSALVLYDEKFSRKAFKSFLEKRKYEESYIYLLLILLLFHFCGIFQYRQAQIAPVPENLLDRRSIPLHCTF